MEDFNEQAIVVIYPDGTIEKIEITDKLLHMHYFRMLYEKSPRFKKAIQESNIDLDEISANIRGGYSNLNFFLSELGIISFLNLRIKEIKRNKIYSKAKPYFLVTLPKEISEEQKEVLNNLFKEYDCSKNHYGKLVDFQYIDINYDQVVDIVDEKHYK